MKSLDWQDWAYDCKDDSGQFLNGPGWIKKLVVVANGTGATSVVFYDGHTSGGRHIITMRGATNQTRALDFDIPFHVDQGLYADVGTNLECVSVQYYKSRP